MKKTLLLLGIMLCGCGVSRTMSYEDATYNSTKTQNAPETTINGHYKLILKSVERPKAAQELFGDCHTDDLSCRDGLVGITWKKEVYSMHFTLENLSKSSLRIIWDQAVYVGTDSKSGKVLHKGISSRDRNKPQTPSVVVQGSKIEDFVNPYDMMFINALGLWQSIELLPTSAKSMAALEQMNTNYIGKTLAVLLPLQTQEVTYDYLFTFEIESFVIE